MIGKCTSCNKAIMTLKSLKSLKALKALKAKEVKEANKNNKWLKLDIYREHTLELSNNTLMRVAVCIDCKVKLVSSNLVKNIGNTILKKHKEYWKNQKDKPKGFEKFTVVDYNTNFSKFRQKQQIRKHEQHLERLKVKK